MDTAEDIQNNSLRPGEAEIQSDNPGDTAGGGLQAAGTNSAEKQILKPEEKQTPGPASGQTAESEPAQRPDAAQTSETASGQTEESEPTQKPDAVQTSEPRADSGKEQASKSGGEQAADPDKKELYSVDWISLILVLICLVNIFYWYINLEVVNTTDSRVFLAYPTEANFKNADLRSARHKGTLPPAPTPKEDTVRRDHNLRGADGRLSDGLPHGDGSIINNDVPGADGKLSDGLPHYDDEVINGEAPGADGRLSDGLPHNGDGGGINHDVPGADGKDSDGLPHNEDYPGYDAGDKGGLNGEVVSQDVIKSVQSPPGTGK